MEYKYVVIFQPETNDVDDSTSENYLASHAEFYKSLRDIENNFDIDHTTISKRFKTNNSTFFPKKDIWIIKLS